jgi:hypothetical protein
MPSKNTKQQSQEIENIERSKELEGIKNYPVSKMLLILTTTQTQ